VKILKDLFSCRLAEVVDNRPSRGKILVVYAQNKEKLATSPNSELARSFKLIYFLFWFLFFFLCITLALGVGPRRFLRKTRLGRERVGPSCAHGLNNNVSTRAQLLLLSLYPTMAPQTSWIGSRWWEIPSVSALANWLGRLGMESTPAMKRKWPCKLFAVFPLLCMEEFS